MQLSSSHSEGTLLSSPIMQYYTNHKILFIPSGSSFHMKHHHCCPQYITAHTTIQCKLQHNCLNPFRIKPSHETSSLLSSIYHSTHYNSVQIATQLFKSLQDQAFIWNIITVVLNITLHRLQFKLQHNCLNPFRIKLSYETSSLLSSIYHSTHYSSVQTATQLFKSLQDQAFIWNIITVVLSITLHRLQFKLQHNCLNPFRIKLSYETSSLLSSIYHSTDYSSVQTATQLFKSLQDQAFIWNIITVVLNITLHRLQFSTNCNNNNLHLSCAHQRPECSPNTY